MLRRKSGARGSLDIVDQELLESVDAGLPWRVLLRSASCAPDEAEGRILRMLHLGFLEGTTGDEPRRVTAPPQAQPTARSAPSSRAPSASTTPPPAAAVSAREALLRELRARRGETSTPAPEFSRKDSMQPPVSAQPSAPRPSPIEPGRSGVSLSPVAITNRASSSSADNSSVSFSQQVYSPLVPLIEELAHGQGIQRWSAARLREALAEERAGNYMQAVAILQVVMAQFEDPRMRGERDRLQAMVLQAASGVHRSQALVAERSSSHAEAAEHWRKVLDARPTDAEAALHAAFCLMEAGDLKQAGAYARRAAELAPDSVGAHQILLRFFRKTGMEASAEREREILKKLRKA